uniref:Uncharacterized protein n=1 Tax=Globodera rostochiensis TaxID=31243 RepID=A0A914GPZ6_GLORO
MVVQSIFLIALVHPIGTRFLDRKVDNCFYALRHRGTASAELLAKMVEWKMEDIKQGNRPNEHDCRGNFAGCQTYSCLDGAGANIFVINACAPDGGNCTHGDLDPFCSAEIGTPKCEICHRGLCNRHKVELTAAANALSVPNSSSNANDTDEGAVEEIIEL